MMPEYEDAIATYRVAASVTEKANAARACIRTCQQLVDDASMDPRARATWALTRDNWRATLDTLITLGAPA